MKYIVLSSVLFSLLLVSCQNNTKTAENTDQAEVVQSSQVTAEMAYDGVNNYCHREYDWSVAERFAEQSSDEDPIMWVSMGEETDSTYQVVFRSYTGAFVYFYVAKSTGATRMVDYVPALDIESEAGTINLYDYLDKKEKINLSIE